MADLPSKPNKEWNTVHKDTADLDDDNDDNDDNRGHRKVEIAKRLYVFIALAFGFGLALLKSVYDPLDDWLDVIQEDIILFLWDHPGWTVVIIALLTVMKSFSIKDVFGLRTITVVILSWKFTNKSEIGTLILAMFFMGILSSISKLAEYRAIGKELQFILGAPTKFMMKYIKLALIKLCFNEDKLVWFDTKYILEISYKSRNDVNMDIINNFQHRYGNGIDEEHDKTSKWYMHQCMTYVGAVLWTSCVEWVQPITELFLFAHNWKLTVSNVLIIVFAEFADFDKAVETWYMIEGLKDGDLIGAKIQQLPIKGYFWIAGYTIILFPTLLWGYKYHKVYIKVDNERVDQHSQPSQQTESKDAVVYHHQTSTKL